MNLIDNGTDDVEYENMHYTILDVRISNMSLVIPKGEVCSIDAEDSYCNGYFHTRHHQFHYLSNS